MGVASGPRLRHGGEGIWFERPEILYLDYAYFSRLSSVSLSLGGLGVGAGLSIGVHAVAESVLRNRLFRGVTMPANTVRKVGAIADLPDEDMVEMEGEAWQVLLFAEEGRLSAPDVIPVLFYAKAIGYPRELWRFIRSPLTVFGEERQIPIRAGDREWASSIAARAIGFVS